MANDRDCENCKHYKEVLCKGGIFYHSCESWDCEFEPKEDEPFEPCEDAISRQAVLDLLVKYDNDMKFDVYSEIFDNINKLPPVNPQKPICPSAGVDCEDAISRAELLKAIDTWDKFGYTETGCFVREPKNDCVKYTHYDDVIECIKGMPPVNPQKPICPSAGVDCEDCPAYEKKPNINEVLDKIRAEIMDCLKALDEIEKSGLNIYLPNEISGRRLTYQQCLEFIDKYKAEGSGEE